MIHAVGSLFMLVITFLCVTVGLFVVVKLFQGFGILVRGFGRGLRYGVLHLVQFVRGLLVDTVHFAGSLITALAIVPLALINLLIGRFQSAKHYGRALENELASAFVCLYRVTIGHPLRLVFLGPLLKGVERKLPDLMDRAPSEGHRQPGVFEGYEVLGTLPAGGSGAQLFLARPTPSHAADLSARHAHVPDRVVIKSFMLGLGSTLPQMIREGRALEAARRLGLLVEHRLSETSFYYVMPYVNGEELGTLTDKLHAAAPREGLGEPALRLALSWSADLLRTLERFHTGGLWHKDIKPANVIVADGRAHLVDFGLVTPLASGMTLTTHGTEYYRDPEMVRMAMRGVKVHEVDGVKFDLYSTGALLYSMVEGSFPAHGSLSQLSRRCPESLRWIIRRAMADVDSRYTSAAEMRADLDVVRAAKDPFALRPADLPSLGGERVVIEQLQPESVPAEFARAAASSVKAFKAEPALSAPSKRRCALRRVFAAAVVLFVAVIAIASARRGHARSYEGDGSTQAVVYGSSESIRLSPTTVYHPPAHSRQSSLLDRSAIPAPLLRFAESDSVQPAFLVLSDSVTWARHGKVLEDLAGQCEALGFRVLDRGGSDQPGDLDVIAGARNAVQFSDPSDPEAIQDLQRFLDETVDLDGVLWVSDSGKRGLATQLLFRDVWREPASETRAEPKPGEQKTYAIF